MPKDRTQEHIDILRMLADGENPLTGEDLPSDSPYQDARIMRALLAAIESLKENDGASSLLPKAGSPWTAEQDEQLGRAFDSGRKVAELAVEHGRTSGAIRSRLKRIGRLDA